MIANPSSHVAERLDEAAPYGLGGIFAPGKAEARLRAYLALPLTIYLGGRDTGHKGLHGHPAARRQDRDRLDRRRRVFAAAAERALREGWAFNWSLVVAPGVGHCAACMLDAPQAAEAFGLRAPRPDGTAAPAREPTAMHRTRDPAPTQ